MISLIDRTGRFVESLKHKIGGIAVRMTTHPVEFEMYYST